MKRNKKMIGGILIGLGIAAVAAIIILLRWFRDFPW